MAAKKPPKAELMAICRLEFYRKQKNWKFCSEERKGKESKRRAKANKVKLNQTYSIGPGPEIEKSAEPEKSLLKQHPDQKVETEEHADLNQAFVETGTASELDEPATSQNQDSPNVALDAETANKPSSSLEPPNSPYSPRWSIQHWAERCRLWNPEPTCPSEDHPKPHSPPTQEPNLETNYINQVALHEQDYPDHNLNFPYNTNYSNHDINCPMQTYHNTRYIQETFNHKFGANVLYYNPHMRHHGLDLPQNDGNVLSVDRLREWEVEHDWELCAGEGAAWVETNRQERVSAEPEGAWGQCGGVCGVRGAGGEDAVDGAGGALVQRADDWLRRDGLSEESQCDSLPSVASDEFVRGAALAPHSTQIDLLLCPEPPTALSGAALARAVARHSAALKRLLGEARRRDQSPLLSEPLYSFDEIPVRDPGPAGPGYHTSAPAFNDPIVAGSYKNRPDLRGNTEVGRGRGRIKVIGIGMGRPYRL